MLRIINNTSCGFLFLCKAHKYCLVFLCKSTKLKKGIDKPRSIGYNKANNSKQQQTTTNYPTGMMKKGKRTMKLKNELPNVISAFETVKQKIPTHVEWVKKEGNYKDLEIRIARDLLYATKGTKWICDLYDRYDCNDDHIDTLARQALRQVYPIKEK